jgi:hypothetical protein
MNLFWKDFLVLLFEMVMVGLILFNISQKTNDRLSIFLMSVLLLIIVIHLIINIRRMLFNFGFWFSCRH